MKLDNLLGELLDREGTELFLVPGAPPSVRTREGIVPLGSPPLEKDDVRALVLTVAPPAQKEALDVGSRTSFAFVFAGKTLLRVSCMFTTTGLTGTFSVISSPKDIVAEPYVEEALKGLAAKRGGLVLVTGPFRSGKHATLAALVRLVNESRACRIVTIEQPNGLLQDPVRAVISQREIGRSAPKVAAAAYDAVHAGADVVTLAEIPDRETAMAVFRLAQQGTLVCASLRGGTPAAAVDRLLDAFAPEEHSRVRGMLADVVAAVIAQRFVRGTAGGRVLACEVIHSGTALAAWLRDGKGAGFPTTDAALERLLAHGKISAEHALDAAFDKDQLVRAIAKAAAAPSA